MASNKIICLGGKLQCESYQTCCVDVLGQYGCCNYSRADCSSTIFCCCPHGYVCEGSLQTCFPPPPLVIPAAPINEIQLAQTDKVVRCDRKYACPDKSTCCRNKQKQWMCCPFPQAICCSDHVHCCPIHTKCVQQGLKCQGGKYLFSMAAQFPALSRKKNMLSTVTKYSRSKLQETTKQTNSKSVTCPGGESQCPNGNTCCELTSGQYGCCPLPKAVCCSDGVHCCPNGYTCDVSAGACSRGSEKIAFFAKRPAKSLKVKSGNVVCQGGQSECLTGNTCCKLSSGQYGCCPLPKAVCCSDHIHCCPNGYTCDVSAGTCSRGSEKIPFSAKRPAKSFKGKSTSVVCPDGESQCPDGNTCCKLRSGQYGCCPLPRAVCCSDGIHCCPSGYACDVSAGTCSRGLEKINLLRKQPAKSLKVKSTSIVCPGGHSQCPTGNTCCRLSSGQYGCCPLPNAVCCSDGVHCCPNGYTCDVSAGTCSRGSEKITFSAKRPAKSLKVKSTSVVCPDGQSQCPDGNTCCKLRSGQYGCCPLPRAVCCSDGVRCCPNGYTCDISAGTCSRGSEKIHLLIKQPAKSLKVKGASVVCPGGQSQCPDGNTCCKLSSGQYGCCPLPKAECCSDGVHCCPNGYTCDVSAGTCSKGSTKILLVEKRPAKFLKGKSTSVVCPDEESQCPEGNTCCKLSSGQYGCCPLPRAVCCSDGVHCCPNGYTCDVSAGTCSKGSEKIHLFRKRAANFLKVKSTSVVCPDGQSQCPDGNTCCKLSSGQYGCCPLPRAVCCSDGVHCCPSGYTCDVSAGTCSRRSEKINLLRKQPAKFLKVKSTSVVCPGGHSQCPTGNTCCRLSSGQYGCCPLPRAVCCSDGIHCCPRGYTCDVSAGTCSRGLEKINLLRKQPAKSLKVKSTSVVCPGGHSQCPTGNTCCKLSSGQYGCCPLPRAVCCSDGIHCCPRGYTCDVSAGTCNKGSKKIYLLRKQPAKSLKAKDTSIVCPDGQSQCPDGNTCCKLSSGQYGCCPLPRAVCCSDGVHCCPSGYTCDVSAGICSRGLEKINLLRKQPAKSLKVESTSVVCPGGQSQCPDGNTCCKLSSGQYGCCPLPRAVCCSDGIHCCPRGYTCDVSAGTCSRGLEKINLLRKQPAKSLKVKSTSVVCPGGHSQCPDGNTCCRLSSGQYGCCPLPRAVCCSDGVHCCPRGYTCDVSAGTCSRGLEKINLLRKQPTKSLKVESTSVVCPDGESQCPDGNTCCRLSSGQYGCCPLPRAVCCSDGIHCCPRGYTCDVSAGTCSRGLEKINLLRKQPAKSLKVKSTSVVCPDGESQCPDGNTCCKLSSGQYGCCPLPRAVCCSDGIHCCPSGYTCDVSAGTCSRGLEKTNLLRKQPAKSLKVKSTSVVCPDGESQCPEGNTCCKLSSGQYGCCPLPRAVCCSDGVHCCPNGYTCDVSAGTCSKGSEKIHLFRKRPANFLKVKSTSVVCPDGQSQCPDGNTCCKLSSGQYGCCPLPRAVCCSDGVHCCPSGYTCDVSAGTCSRGLEKINLLRKQPAKSLKVESTSVVCPDGESQCPDGNTCCKLSSGQYGCCPLPRAVCCSDGVHCCPSGYTCDVSAGTCSRGLEKINLLRKQPAKSLKVESTSVVCPDGESQCPDGNTCCKLSSGQYGCCPLPRAVCCSDGIHCCPRGYTCDVSAGTCSRGLEKINLLRKQPTKSLKVESTSVVCPDGQSQCPDGNTCCELSSGQYGCCPLPRAVCCSDGVHCCPSGYTCDVSAGTCSRGLEKINLLRKQPAKSLKVESTSVVCPDGESQCPDGNTCCKLSSGQYGCCPLPRAVCCSDGVHCCPSGYTCDVSAGTCSKGKKEEYYLHRQLASKLKVTGIVVTVQESTFKLGTIYPNSQILLLRDGFSIYFCEFFLWKIKQNGNLLTDLDTVRPV